MLILKTGQASVLVKYVEQDDPPEKQRYRLTDDDAREALKDYYDAVDTLSEVQANLTAPKFLKRKLRIKQYFRISSGKCSCQQCKCQ